MAKRALLLQKVLKLISPEISVNLALYNVTSCLALWCGENHQKEKEKAPSAGYQRTNHLCILQYDIKGMSKRETVVGVERKSTEPV